MYSERPPPHPPIPCGRWWKTDKILTRIRTIQVAKGHTLYAPDAQQSHDSFRQEIMGSLWRKKVIRCSAKVIDKKKSHTITFWPIFHLSPSIPVPRLAMVPEILPKWMSMLKWWCKGDSLVAKGHRKGFSSQWIWDSIGWLVEGCGN